MRYPSIRVPGSLVLVTGGGRGIGLATARLFAERGARVVVGDVDLDVAEAAAADIGRGVTARWLDVSDAQAFADFAGEAQAQHGGAVDVLVNNAGVMPTGAFLEQSTSLDEVTFAVNTRGLIHGMRAVLPTMCERGSGHVVNVASLAGKVPVPGLAVYNASKFAAVGLGAAVRLETAASGVSVSTVLPSAVRTELSAGIDYGVLPAVGADDVAAAVLHTLRTRRAETVVPRYLGAVPRLAALTPEPVMRAVRRVVGDDRAVTSVDPAVRERYLRRILG